ncbi:MAG TPA: VTT domain-containing protein [Solirubrobacteraceae bacterium]|nr:VTT domain-containing protein [Solirubrobacteraceae bacterium]
MRPAWIAGAVALALYLGLRRRAHGRGFLALGALAAVGTGLIGFGAIELPNVEHLIEEAGEALGEWTYLAVGLLAFLETGAFIGLVAPGETTVIVGGLVAGQGEISLLLLIAIVWTCAVLGDVTSYVLGRRLGREFLVRHGDRVKITEERLQQVEAFFERRGGMTILIGRFIGLVRAIAPFIAGASRMPLRKFLPYDVLGAGLWATTFCVLGYVFWRSFDQLTAWVSRGLFAFGLFVALVVAIVFLVRLQRSPELQQRTKAWIVAQLEKPRLRPLAPYLRAGWRRVGRPLARRSQRPAQFVWNRLTPGDLGLEITTLLSLAAVGAFTFVLLGDAPDERTQERFDELAFEIADGLYSEPVKDALVWFTALGALPVVALLVAATALWAAARARYVDAAALVVALLLTWLAVDVAKVAYDRPRPPGPHVATEGMSYPSGHSAYAVAWVACAVVLVRAGAAVATRYAAVTAAVVLAVAIALTRVYLRAHYLSDVDGGLALATAIFALVGLAAVVVGHLRQNEPSRR